jgi:hypothetical protein
MKIKEVIVRTVVVINGIEYIRNQEDWTQSINDGEKEGIKFIKNQDVFDWVGE